jgi:uncharacterized OsmC-like protein
VHNVNTDALAQTIENAKNDPASVRIQVAYDGAWQTQQGAPQFRATIAFAKGETVFEADFPPPMGGTGSAPNPLAYCFWGGLACYAMTFAQEAALKGVELCTLRARVATQVDQSRALGVTDNPPVERMDWYLEVDADAADEQLQDIKRLADEHCPGVWCVRNPIQLDTHLD